MRFDLHVHTDISPCSRLGLDDILGRARALGLDGVCLTDHNTMAASRLVPDGPRPDGLVVVVGMEYSTPDGDFLVFGPLDTLPRGLTGRELLTLVRRVKGAAVAAHPFRHGRNVAEEMFATGLCTVMEAVNGRNSPADNNMTRLLRERYAPAETGGSDAHDLDELGRMVTVFDEPVRGLEDLVAALNLGRCRPHVTARGRAAVMRALGAGSDPVCSARLG